jgi:hypothetical protein
MKRLVIFLLVLVEVAAGSGRPPASRNRVFDWTFESRKSYADPLFSSVSLTRNAVNQQ